MIDNYEKPKQIEDTRSPEEIEQANSDLQGGLNEMYSADRLAGTGRAGIDERKVFDALDSKNLAQKVGTSEARSEIAQVYDEMMANGSPEAATIHSQEKRIAVQAESVAGSATSDEVAAARVGAEVLNNIADKSADEQNHAILSTQDMTKVTRATTAANILERVEKNGDSLEGFTASTKSRLTKFIQMIRNRGGVEKTSNKDLEEAGRYIEQNPDVQQEVEAVEEQEPVFDAKKLAVAWVNGDRLTVERDAAQLPDSTRETVEAYIAASKQDPEHDKTAMISDVTEIIESATSAESVSRMAA